MHERSNVEKSNTLKMRQLSEEFNNGFVHNENGDKFVEEKRA